MIFLLLGSAIILLFYAFILSLSLWGWVKGDTNKRVDAAPHYIAKGVTVVIPFHNEATKLPLLLSQLAKSKSVGFNVEYIFVNDHSTDDWLSVTSDVATVLDAKWIDSHLKGKKNAIYQAVSVATFDVILTTDADCLPHEEWISTMANTYYKSRCKMLFGPVTLLGDNSLLSYFQSVDYAAMAAIGGGSANAGFPFICSGANLMFSKESYLAVFKHIRLEYASGDDVFLLHAFKKSGCGIAFCQSPTAMVQSSTEKCFRSLVNQRVRWGAKAKGYHDLFSIFVSLTVFVLSLLMVYAFVYSVVNSSFWVITVGLFLIKMGLDFIFLSQILAFFKIKAHGMRLFFIQIFYPFWILYIAFQGFWSNSAWKNRAI